MDSHEYDKETTVKVTDVDTQQVVAIDKYLDEHMGQSFTIIQVDSLEFSVDVERHDGEPVFELGMGTGFSGIRNSVNIIIGDLTLDEFEKVIKSMQEVVNHYKTPTCEREHASPDLHQDSK